MYVRIVKLDRVKSICNNRVLYMLRTWDTSGFEFRLRTSVFKAERLTSSSSRIAVTERCLRQNTSASCSPLSAATHLYFYADVSITFHYLICSYLYMFRSVEDDHHVYLLILATRSKWNRGSSVGIATDGC
jgi:hypothetical protein